MLNGPSALILIAVVQEVLAYLIDLWFSFAGTLAGYG